jgi:hypothetical protein
MPPESTSLKTSTKVSEWLSRLRVGRETVLEATTESDS